MTRAVDAIEGSESNGTWAEAPAQAERFGKTRAERSTAPARRLRRTDRGPVCGQRRSPGDRRRPIAKG